MKVKIGEGYGLRACELTIADDFKFVSKVDCGDYDEETIKYAIIKYIKNNQIMLSKFIDTSYKKRFAKGQDRKASRERIDIPAKVIELPGKKVVINLAIDPMGIKIDSLYID